MAVQWLNESLYFVSSFVMVDSFRLQNRQLFLAKNLCVGNLKQHWAEKNHQI
jgi:hypothetical protein